MTDEQSRNGDPRVALVTGATGGIGGAIARELAHDGVRVVATGRDAARAEATARELESTSGTPCIGVSLDVTHGESIETLVRAIESFGTVDWLVNNAGIAETTPAASANNHALTRRLMEVNLFGPLRLASAFVPGMVERGGGAILQVASSASLRGYPYVSAYAASKHALLGWTRSAALELAPKGVAVSAVCPHYVDTPLTDRSIETMKEKTGRSDEELRAFVANQNPGGVLVTPGEVAHVALRLLRADRGGVVVELPGGEAITLEEGVALAAR
ncbi:MAG: SDR family NAD(P)-dependent oxidoreductase [Planctomycetota bacterium]